MNNANRRDVKCDRPDSSPSFIWNPFFSWFPWRLKLEKSLFQLVYIAQIVLLVRLFSANSAFSEII